MKSHKIELNVEAWVYDDNHRLIARKKLNKPRIGEDTIEMLVWNSDGSLHNRIEFPFRSFVKNFGQMMQLMMNGTSTGLTDVNWKNTVGNGENSLIYYAIPADAGVGAYLYGIQVGSGTDPVALTDYKLQTQILHGTGAEQLFYSAMDHIEAVSYGSGYRTVIKRAFSNNSGSDITVNETGIVVNNYSYNAPNRYTLIARDRVNQAGEPINLVIQNNQVLEVRYNLFVNAADGLLPNFLNMISKNLLRSSMSYTDIGGTIRTVDFSQTNAQGYFKANGDIGNTTLGIIAGTGTNPVTSSDTNLQSKMLHGSALGEVYYNKNEAIPLTIIGNTVTFGIARVLTNQYSEPQTIKEVGFVLIANGSVGTTPFKILVGRILTGDLTLAPNQSVQLRFAFNTTV